jgi:hypothetical protein
MHLACKHWMTPARLPEQLTLTCFTSHLSSRADRLLAVHFPAFLQAKARKAIVRQAKRSTAEAVVHPDELQDIHEEEKQETDRNMENMWRQLKRFAPGTRVRLTHLVCNHSSFAQTVENIFTLSFLVSFCGVGPSRTALRAVPAAAVDQLLSYVML